MHSHPSSFSSFSLSLSGGARNNAEHQVQAARKNPGTGQPTCRGASAWQRKHVELDATALHSGTSSRWQRAKKRQSARKHVGARAGGVWEEGEVD